MSKVTIQFVEELPEAAYRGRISPWPERFAAVRERPGQWALIDGLNPTVKTSITSGKTPGAAPGEFEAVCRKGKLYVRYVGGES